MIGPDGDDRYREFENAWRAWANRPARRSPRQAAARVSSALRDRTPRRQLWVPAAVAASLLVAVTVSTRWVSSPVRQPAEHTLSAPEESQPLAAGQVVFWLDENTPLYMNFQPPGDDPAGGETR